MWRLLSFRLFSMVRPRQKNPISKFDNFSIISFKDGSILCENIFSIYCLSISSLNFFMIQDYFHRNHKSPQSLQFFLLTVFFCIPFFIIVYIYFSMIIREPSQIRLWYIMFLLYIIVSFTHFYIPSF